MSFQKTNLITSQFVGIDNFVNVLSDPLLGRAVLNTLYFALLALVFGFPLPILLAVLMSEVRRGKGLYSALAYLPVIIPPVVAVLLWKFFYDASPTGVFNTIIGCVGIPPQPWIQNAASAMPSLVLEATWAAAGGSIIIYLAALLSVPPELYDAAEVDGAVDLAQDLARDPAAAARRHLRDAHPAGDRHRAGVPGAVPVHRRRTGEFDGHGAAAHLPLCLPEQPRRRLRRGDGPEPHARGRSSRCCRSSYFKATERWSTT